MGQINRPSLMELIEALHISWGEDTAFGEWRWNLPELNQCAVTALVVQDYFGGDLLRCVTNKGNSHYWNCLPIIGEIDLTRRQFEGEERPIRGGRIIRERDYVLSYPETVKRYEILSERVRIALGE